MIFGIPSYDYLDYLSRVNHMVVFAKILDFLTLVASAPLAFAVAMYITIITTHRNPKKWNDLGWGPLLLYIIYTILNMVFHWWKHRKKYKGLTKVKALLGILFTGVINLLLCGVTYGVTIYFFPGGEKRAVVGKIVLGMIGWALSGVISDLLWQVIWKQQSRVNLK